jgi:hypothetical protein
MKKNRVAITLLALLGTGLIGWGLFSPLVDAPVVGAVRFTENNLGGVATARVLILLLALASLPLGLGGRLSRMGAVVSALALGFLGGLLLSVQRHAMDQVMQIADLGDGTMDEGISKILDQMKYGSGALLCAVGSLILLGTIAFSILKDRRSE